MKTNTTTTTTPYALELHAAIAPATRRLLVKINREHWLDTIGAARPRGLKRASSLGLVHYIKHAPGRCRYTLSRTGLAVVALELELEAAKVEGRIGR